MPTTIKISQLSSHTNPGNTDVLPIVDVDAGSTKKINISELKKTIPVNTSAISLSVATTDIVLLIDATSTAITVTLPTAIGAKGRTIIIKDWKGQANSHNITIAPTLAQTIDGSSSKVINTNYSSFQLISDGANWSII